MSIQPLDWRWLTAKGLHVGAQQAQVSWQCKQNKHLHAKAHTNSFLHFSIQLTVTTKKQFAGI